MTIDNDDLIKTLGNLNTGSFSTDIVTHLDRLKTPPLAESAIKHMLFEASKDGDCDAPTQTVQAKLELLARYNKKIALLLMARLARMVIDTFDHETMDAIDLWFFHEGTRDLVPDLEEMTLEDHRGLTPQYKMRILQWIQSCCMTK